MTVTIPHFPTGNFEIDLGVQNDTAFATLENRFGDGYIQRAADGLNSNRDTWAAKWTNLTNDEATLIMDFLKERAGYKPFYYQAPGDTALKQWTARDLKRQPTGVSGNLAYWAISATLKEEFGGTIEVRIPVMFRGVGAVGMVGDIVGNCPVVTLFGVQASAQVGQITPNKVTINGVVGTGAAGTISTGHFLTKGVGAQGVAGNVNAAPGVSTWFNVPGNSATGIAGIMGHSP